MPQVIMSTLKVGRSVLHLLNLGEQLFLAGGSNAVTPWGSMGTSCCNKETLTFRHDFLEDDQLHIIWRGQCQKQCHNSIRLCSANV